MRVAPGAVSHHMLAHAWALSRTPGGACRGIVRPFAAGRQGPRWRELSTDRDFVSGELGFDGITMNSMDSVSDRDFAVDFKFCGHSRHAPVALLRGVGALVER